MATIEDHELFLCLVDSGSFSAAAEKLGTNTSSVSRQLKKMEKQLGVQLVNRTTRTLKLTQAGELYYHSCKRINEEVLSTRQQLEDMTAKPVGKLNITATPAFTHAILIDAIAAFNREFPNIRIMLDVSDEHLDLIDKSMDLAIRIGELKDSRYKCRHLLSSKLTLCASPEYLGFIGGVSSVEDFANCQFILANHLRSIEKRSRLIISALDVPEQQKTLEVNDTPSIYAAVKAGMGLSLLPYYMIQQDIKTKNLSLVLGEEFHIPHDVYIVFPETAFIPQKTRVFIDFLITYVERHFSSE